MKTLILALTGIATLVAPAAAATASGVGPIAGAAWRTGQDTHSDQAWCHRTSPYGTGERGWKLDAAVDTSANHEPLTLIGRKAGNQPVARGAVGAPNDSLSGSGLYADGQASGARRHKP